MNEEPKIVVTKKYYNVLMTAIAIASIAGILLVANVATNSVISRNNCKQVELVKTHIRYDAIKNFSELDANAKLLGIKVTPQLVARAKADELRTLEIYAPKTCSFWPY